MGERFFFKKQLKAFFVCWLAATIALCWAWALPASAASEKEEIDTLKSQVQILMQRIEQMEKKRAEAPPSKGKAYWDDGFRIEYKDPEKDQEYKFRFRTGIQLRYTYVDTDNNVPVNAENYSSFTMRRLRFYVDGTAPNRDWKYYVHVQLENQASVHTHDAYVIWQKYKYARVQLGRMKIPYSMEFWQSGFMQNGCDRTIFTGDSEMDKDRFGNQIYDFPGSNARLRVGGSLDSNNGFPTGGMVIYRSQGINLNGYVDMFGQKDFLTYWAGVFNGRDTQGLANSDDEMLWSLRVGLNFLPGSDPKGPMGPSGFYHYFMQGDYGYNTRPLAAFVFGTFVNRDRAKKYYDPENSDSNYGTVVKADDPFDTRNYGFDGTLMFRYMGFSCDLEAAWEEFIQDPDGGLQNTWDRWAARINLGYFFVPKKWEVVFKAAYFERIADNSLYDSLASGLGLVMLDDGYAVEDNLQQFRIGVNYYLKGFYHYISAELGWTRREFEKIKASKAADFGFTGPLSSDIEDQDDIRFRIQYQYFF
jgi:hypothetical protein